MKNKMFKLLLVCFASIIFVKNVNAECSYEERKNLLNEAKNIKVDVAVENKTIEQTILDYDGTSEIKEKEIDVINFYVSNLSDNLFIKYYNLMNSEENYIMPSNVKDGAFIIEDRNLIDFYTYYFVIYSANERCVGEEIYTKKVKKPTANPYSGFDICKEDKMEDFKYCKKYLDEEVKISSTEFEKKANNYLNGSESSEETPVETVKNVDYLIYTAIGITVFFALVVIIKINKNKKKKESL